MNNLDIKEIRKKLGVSQEKLAEMLGVHRNTVQNWENGAVIPNTKRNILCNLLNETATSTQLDETAAPGNNDPLIAVLERRITELESLTRTLIATNNTLTATNKTLSDTINRLTSGAGSASTGIAVTRRNQSFDTGTLAIKVAELDPIKYNAKLRKRR